MIAGLPALDVPRLFASVVLLAVVIWRRDMVRRPGPDRHLWCALTGLTLASVLTISIVETLIADLVDVPGLVGALRRSVVMIAAMFTRAMLAELMGRRSAPSRADVGVTVAAVVLSTMPVVIWPTPGPSAELDRGALVDGYYSWLVNYAIYVAVMGWTLLAILRFCIRLVRTTLPGRMRRGVKLIIAGVLLGFVYLIFALPLELGGTTERTSWARLVPGVAMGGSLTLIAVGSAYERVAAAISSARRTARFMHVHWQLHPLWRLVVTASPHVTRRPITQVHRVPVNPSAVVVELELVDRLVEIRDAMRDLADFLPTSEQTKLGEEVARSSVPEHRKRATAAAAAVVVAVRLKTGGGQRQANPRSLATTYEAPPTAGGDAVLPRTDNEQDGDVVAIDRELAVLVPIAREVNGGEAGRVVAGWNASSGVTDDRPTGVRGVEG